ncbi:DNA/RNA non-specific endonuclease [Alkalibacterium sp. 20]|uniref:DNA/RNA non-specific endonuclease n=1 Tax=Alkalibacterium sp. 20 TaxID=1798803 RepID=UPI00210D73B4|nr:DNA/RNA non-specific endonuclease [Alkalibacterium sp. 20]
MIETTDTSSIETMAESIQVEKSVVSEEIESIEEVDSSTSSIFPSEKAEEPIEEVVQTEDDKTDDSIDGYKIIIVDGGSLSGYREPNVRVNIGFENREYRGFTNEYGQLVRVIADEIILQDDDTEPVKSNGRYYCDEAKVPGVENSNLDEGHVIADSLGGVSNAYNITPQDSVLNRHGDQAYKERNIRQAVEQQTLRRLLLILTPKRRYQVNTNIRFSAMTLLMNTRMEILMSTTKKKA